MSDRGDLRCAAVRRAAAAKLAIAVATTAVALALVALAAPAAYGHAFLVKTEPAGGARLSTAPDALLLHFSEPFVAGSERVELRRPGREPVELAKPVVDGNVLRQPLPQSLRGVFVVDWYVLSDDSHDSAGELAFAVRAGGALPDVRGEATPLSWPRMLAMWLSFTGLALAMGGIASERFVWARAGAAAAVRRAPVGLGLALFVGASLAQLGLLLLSRAGGPADGVLGALVGAISTRPGLLSVAVVVLGGLAGALAASARLRALALAPLVLATFAVAARGHSGTSGHAWSVPANAVHLAAGALWAGALIHAALVLWSGREARRDLLALGARRYAALALPAVIATLTAGALTALAQFGRPAELLTTGYGRTLLVKGGLVGLALAVALAARLLALPPRTPGEPARARLHVAHLLGAAGTVALVAALVSPQPTWLAALALFVGSLVYLALRLRRLPEVRDPRKRARKAASILAAALAGLLASAILAAVARAGAEGAAEAAWTAPLRVVLLAVAVALAIAALVRALPQPRRAAAQLLRRLTAAEALMLLAVLAAGAILANVPPPRSAPANTRAILGPPPLEGPTIRLADLAGHLVVGSAVTRDELRFEVVLPSSGLAPGARLTAEARKPNGVSTDLRPRPCGDGCFTIRYRLPNGTTTITARASAPGWRGGEARFEVAWPPGEEQADLLGKVIRTLRRAPAVKGTERVTSGPGYDSRALRFRMSGKEFLDTELYQRGAVDVRVLDEEDGLRELAFALPASRIWYRMWIDERFRIRRERILSPGHLITRKLDYPQR